MSQKDASLAFSRFKLFMTEMTRLNPTLLKVEDFKYKSVVDALMQALKTYEAIDGTPKMDFNDPKFTEDYEPNEHEIKLVINELGMEFVEISNINSNLS